MNPIMRQGDVHVFQLDEFPKGKRSQDAQCKKNILAYGEVSGHCHQVVDGDVEVFRILDKLYSNLLFLNVKKTITIQHGRDQEFTGVEADQDYHKPLTIEPGKYCTGIVQEVDHLTGVVRQVAD